MLTLYTDFDMRDCPFHIGYARLKCRHNYLFRLFSTPIKTAPLEGACVCAWGVSRLLTLIDRQLQFSVKCLQKPGFSSRRVILVNYALGNHAVELPACLVYKLFLVLGVVDNGVPRDLDNGPQLGPVSIVAVFPLQRLSVPFGWLCPFSHVKIIPPNEKTMKPWNPITQLFTAQVNYRISHVNNARADFFPPQAVSATSRALTGHGLC